MGNKNTIRINRLFFFTLLVCVLGFAAATTHAAIIRVPSDQPTIQQGINAADYLDTVLVEDGVYSGQGNYNLNFYGIDRVLMSEHGSLSTTIDVAGLGRAFLFNNGETSQSIVQGFAIENGDPLAPGCAIRVGSTGASPVFRDLRIRFNSIDQTYSGIVLIEAGSPSFRGCLMRWNSSAYYAGVVWITTGSPTFLSCVIQSNVMAYVCVVNEDGYPTFQSTNVLDNDAPDEAVLLMSPAYLQNCVVANNSGDGIRFTTGYLTSTVNVCTFRLNGGAGIVLEGNSTAFSGGAVLQNQGGGIVIRNVVGVYAASEGRGGDPETSPGGDASPATTSPSFTNMVIAGNVNTSSPGGGILFDCSNVPGTTFAPTYTNCTVTGNSSSFDGGGVAVCGTAAYADILPLFDNCTISSNTAGGDGGGIHMGATAAGASVNLTLDKTIVWGNCAVSAGDEAYTDVGNAMTMNCVDVNGLGLDGGGSIYVASDVTFDDPTFCAPPSCATEGTIEGDFTLDISSAASPDSSPCGLLIGAHPVACAITAVDGEVATPPTSGLDPPAPNPFNPATVIPFRIAEPAHVTLVVYDVRGRRVRSLLDRSMSAARYEMVWDGRDDRGTPVASGVYFVRLVAGNVTESRRVVMVK